VTVGLDPKAAALPSVKEGDRVMRSTRPAFLNLVQIQMPVGAVTSIGHRVSGILLAVGVPIGVYLLAHSLEDEQAFAEVTGLLRYWVVKGAAVVLVWALAHHALAGVRHLLSDFNVGSPLRRARRSAWLVNLGGVGVALFAAGVVL
jgi:succinate dehydrogenase / fumarate reductase cytochrome b subunit